jgi:uncharacterized cupin superfamily protein
MGMITRSDCNDGFEASIVSDTDGTVSQRWLLRSGMTGCTHISLWRAAAGEFSMTIPDCQEVFIVSEGMADIQFDSGPPVRISRGSIVTLSTNERVTVKVIEALTVLASVTEPVNVNGETEGT